MKKINQSRREFLTRCAIMSAAGVASPLASLGSMSSAFAASSSDSEYRAMVCVYLVGGNDLNMLVPTDNTQYGYYQTMRDDLALSRDSLLPINSNINGDNTPFGLHPSCSGMQELYNKGNLAFINNIGSLIEPTTAAEFKAKSVRLPPKIASHNSQKEFVQTGLPEGDELTGWAGRIADMFQSAGATKPLNFSFSGDNVWQRGSDTVPYGLSGSSITTLQHFRDDFLEENRLRKQALERINNLQDDHLLTSEYGRILQSSLDLSDELRSGIGQQEVNLQTAFPSTRAGQLFRNTARVINARKGLETPQQTFYIVLGGWDQHRGLLQRHQGTLSDLDGGLAAFYKALEEMGLENHVTTFTNHDFGRKLTSNGQGSDHAWGGQQLVMGGAVEGGKVYGETPAYIDDDPQLINGTGMLAPSTSTDQLSASIAQWFGGFSDSQLIDLFPNLSNFNNTTLDIFNS